MHQVSGIRGEVLPAFSVANGAVLEANFGASAYSMGMPMGLGMCILVWRFTVLKRPRQSSQERR